MESYGSKIEKVGTNYKVYTPEGILVCKKRTKDAAEKVVLTGNLAALTAEQRKELGIIVAPAFVRGTLLKVTDSCGNVVDAEFFRVTCTVEYPANSGKFYAIFEVLSPIDADYTGLGWVRSNRFARRFTTYALYLAPSEDNNAIDIKTAARIGANGKTCKLANPVFDGKTLLKAMKGSNDAKASILNSGVNAFAYPNVSIGDTIWWTWGNTRVMPMKVEGDFGLYHSSNSESLHVTMRCSTLAPYRKFKTGDWGDNQPYVFWPEGNERWISAEGEGTEWFRSAKECADVVIPAICETNSFDLLGDGCFRSLDKDTFVFELEGGTDNEGDSYTLLVEYHTDEDRWVFQRVYEDDTVDERMLPPKKDALMNLGEAAMRRMQ